MVTIRFTILTFFKEYEEDKDGNIRYMIASTSKEGKTRSDVKKVPLEGVFNMV